MLFGVEKQISVPECGRHTRQNATKVEKLSASRRPLSRPRVIRLRSDEVGFLSALSPFFPPCLVTSCIARLCTVPFVYVRCRKTGICVGGDKELWAQDLTGQAAPLQCYMRVAVAANRHLRQRAHGMCVGCCRSGTRLEDLLAFTTLTCLPPPPFPCYLPSACIWHMAPDPSEKGKRTRPTNETDEGRGTTHRKGRSQVCRSPFAPGVGASPQTG